MTLTELARLAHVSTSTASKAFALSPEVNQETRNMVFDVAKANGCFKKFYRSEYPGLLFAIICPEFESTYYSSFISEMQKYLSKYNSEVAVAATGFDGATEQRLLEYYRRYHTVDGIILINGFTPVESNSEIPTATVNCYRGCKGAINVKVNSHNLINEMVSEWKSKGVCEIGFIGDCYTGQRLKSLKKALEENSLKKIEEHFVSTNERFELSGYLGAKELIARGKLPRALLCAYDRIALGAMRAFSEKGIRVPEEVAMFSVDDAPGSAYSIPSLTSVSHRVDEVCRAVAKSLMAKIKGEAYDEELEFECELIRRESSVINP
jgi:LacI family transcriptional regulator